LRVVVLPFDVRLLALIAIGLALLLVVAPLLAVVMVLAVLVGLLFFRAFSRPPRFPAEVRFWPKSRPRAAASEVNFYEHEPRPDTND
jgi:hypothetical protein